MITRLIAAATALIGMLVAPATATTPPMNPVAQVKQLDAHDGGIIQHGNDFYLYGTSYGCGFEWQIPGTRWCGVRLYTSPDLIHWTSRGYAVDGNLRSWQLLCAPGGCFRPHVIRNPNTGQYVMWMNAANTQSYIILTAPGPAGPWRWHSNVTPPRPSGDESLFVDSNGAGYLIRTDLAGQVATTRTHELAVDRLDDTYTRIVDTVGQIPGVGFVEAPSVFRRNGIYYLTYSNPACPYCTGAGTAVVQSRSMAGPWSQPYIINSRCGQPTKVTPVTRPGRVVLYYQTDLWERRPGDTITRNQNGARQAWLPLAFTPVYNSRIAPFSCPA